MFKSYSSSLCFYHHITFSSNCSQSYHYLPLKGHFLLHLGPILITGYFPYVKDPLTQSHLQSSFHHVSSHSQVPGIRTWISLEASSIIIPHCPSTFIYILHKFYQRHSWDIKSWEEITNMYLIIHDFVQWVSVLDLETNIVTIYPCPHGAHMRHHLLSYITYAFPLSSLPAAVDLPFLGQSCLPDLRPTSTGFQGGWDKNRIRLNL